MTVSKGTVVLVGSAVGIPVGDWGLAYGLVTDVCEDGCHAKINVDNVDIVVDLAGADFAEDVPMSWEGKSLNQMTEHERAAFHTVWSNHWIPVQYKNSHGTWVTPRANTRKQDFERLNRNEPRRIKPSEAVEKHAAILAQYEEIERQIGVLRVQAALLKAEL